MNLASFTGGTDRTRTRRVIDALLPLVLAALALAARSFATATPLDPTWIGGIYDDADLDEAVALAASLSSAFDAPHAVVPAPAPRLEPPAPARVDDAGGGARIALPGRAPPLA